MRLIVCAFLLVSVPSLALSQSSSALQREQQQAKAREVQDLLFHRQYDEAKSKIQAVIDQWPEDALGYYGMMILYQLKNFENMDQRFQSQYLKWNEHGRKRAIRTIKSTKSDAWSLFIASGTLGLSAMSRLNQGQTVRALREGSMAIHALKKALKQDPEWVEPYFGLGLYNYWRSVYTNRWTFLPFFPDKREQGIGELKKVIQSGSFAAELSRGSLALMYFNEKKYGETNRITASMVRKYPRNVILKTLRARTLAKLKKYNAAQKIYERLLKQHPSLTKTNLYLARLYFERAKLEQAQRKKTGQEEVPVEAYEEVLPWIQRYVDAEPNAKKRWKAEAYSLWGETLYQLSRWDESKAKFRLALKADYSLYHSKQRLKELKPRH